MCFLFLQLFKRKFAINFLSENLPDKAILVKKHQSMYERAIKRRNNNREIWDAQ